MQIASTAQPTLRSFDAGPSLPAGWHADFSRGIGPLSDKEIDMISAATGTKFNWPPKADVDHFPQAAMDLALAHIRQMADKSPLTEFTSTAALSALHTQGIIGQAFLDKATDYMKAHPDNGSSTTSTRSSMQPGTVGVDGSVYL
jgi:hypothetical protein